MTEARLAIFHPEFLEDLKYWVSTDRRTALRLLAIVDETMRDPFSGRGQPEPLKHDLAGFWSRRLTLEHRIVYAVTGEFVEFTQARYHYEK
jgi:toxin YoeB